MKIPKWLEAIFVTVILAIIYMIVSSLIFGIVMNPYVAAILGLLTHDVTDARTRITKLEEKTNNNEISRKYIK